MEHGLSSGAAMPTGDKQQPLSGKKVALRDLPNETRNIITSPQGTSPLTKQREPSPGALKVSGTKRHHPDCPPSLHHQSACSTGTNGHLVYVRRKLEETGKSSTVDLGITVPPMSKKINTQGKEQNHQQDHMQEPRVSCFPSPTAAASLTISSRGPSVPPSVGLPVNGLLAAEPNSSMFSSVTPALSNRPSLRGIHWKDRFLMLQIYLNKCDQSSQEEYVKSLRSLSALGRSMHAVELEKRAIHLLLEEGKELRRMKLLNVLGKVSPN
uniref:NADH-ubiquinone oxidoreductase 30. subunit, mitochondrial n=1 Tax=Anthurium amnicola TaxID=1678845 RepID=A0A1D1YPN6_9ARAE